MATPRSQRIGIWIITIVLMMGTLGSFIVMGLSLENQKIDNADLQAEQADLETVFTEYQAAVAAQSKTLSDKYFTEFSQYSTIPVAFEASAVTELVTNDLKIGDGADIAADSEYNAYYIGWNPTGTVFDQSISGTELKAPLPGGNMIAGWNEGVIGMKVGGVRELTIPSAKAYGETGSGENIPPNTPLKFIVMIIPKVEEVPVPQALLDYYQSQMVTE